MKALPADAASLRIALLQCAPLPLDVAGNLRRLRTAALQAAGQGADLLVCPEMFLTGYAIGADAVRRLAEPRDGASAQAVAGIAREAGLAIAYGYPESDATDAAPFNAAQFIDADGRPCGHYRKTHLFGGLDRAQFSVGDGAHGAAQHAAVHTPFGVFEWRGWRVGLLICYDIEFPEPARALALAGADLIVVPTANMRAYDAVPRTLVPARAYENQLFVAYANYVGSEPTHDPSSHPLDYGGLSCVAAPAGTALARAGDAPTLLVADLDFATLQASRLHTPYLVGRRPALYAALVQTAGR